MVHREEKTKDKDGMKEISNINSFAFERVRISSHWNTGEQKEEKIHKIHSYPAKFPAFITTKAIEHVEKEYGFRPERIADPFCGCGTTAFEAKRQNINFWGCDINPVATLIATAKTRKYQPKRLERYCHEIMQGYLNNDIADTYDLAHERLKYWYTRKQFNNLAHLKSAILANTAKESDYREFFLCGFSNILKPTSRWLMKSIKPTVDPNKNPIEVMVAFEQQCRKMILANEEIGRLSKADSRIVTGNFLDDSLKVPKMDMIITSPPYATSYEYADLHQLSSLWLDFTDDYKKLRKGSIGSIRNVDFSLKNIQEKLNKTGFAIVSSLRVKNKSKARSVAKYFFDMQKVAKRSFDILKKGGVSVFVIGNTKYKEVHVNNTQHLAEALYDAGFTSLSITRRKISNKCLPAYRDKQGRFTSNLTGRKIYATESVIIARKAE